MEAKKILKGIGVAALNWGTIGAIIYGTWSGNEGGLAPLYNKKVGKSGGINIGLFTRFTPGSEFYGINLSLFTLNDGKINGLNLNAISGGNVSDSLAESKVNGLEASIFCNYSHGSITKPSNVNGIQASLFSNTAENINGVQASLFYNNAQAVGNHVQFGIYNSIKIDSTKAKRGLLMNYHFNGKGRR